MPITTDREIVAEGGRLIARTLMILLDTTSDAMRVAQLTELADDLRDLLEAIR